MSTEKINARFAVLALFIILVAALRIPNSASLTPWSNFTPIGAMGLFGGPYFNKTWKAILFPLLTLFISDLVIQAFVYGGKYGILYGGWYIVYGIFILIALIGYWLIKKVTPGRVLGAALLASFTHWGISDFSYWAAGGLDLRTMTPLSRGLDGLTQAYVQGWPFFKNFLIGTVVYSAIMFGSFEWLRRSKPSVAQAHQ